MKLKFSLISILVIFVFNGCANKEIVKYKFIYPKLPILKTYEFNKTLDFGKVYNKGNKICIVKWGACIPKSKFKVIVNCILDLKSKNDKLNTQIKKYNNFKRLFDGRNEK